MAVSFSFRNFIGSTAAARALVVYDLMRWGASPRRGLVAISSSIGGPQRVRQEHKVGSRPWRLVEKEMLASGPKGSRFPQTWAMDAERCQWPEGQSLTADLDYETTRVGGEEGLIGPQGF